MVYFVVAQGIRERSDTWLSGEAEVLAHVSADTPKDHLYKRIVGEVAELATQEVPDERNSRGERLNSVFFLAMDPTAVEPPLWVGPGSREAFSRRFNRRNLFRDVPQSIGSLDGNQTFRVVVQAQDGKTVYLGLSDRGAKSSAAPTGPSFPHGLGRHVPPRLRDLVLERPAYPAPRRTHHGDGRANRHQGLE